MERNPMTDSEAVKILGLGNSFTGEEELSAYRNLVKKYHPDNFETATESEKSNAHEMMIKVNAAHDYLKTKYFSNPSDIKVRINIGNTYYSNYKEQSNKSSYNNYKTEELKKDLIRRLELKTFARIYNVDKEFEDIFKELAKIFQKYKYEILYDTEDNFGSLFKKAMDEITIQYFFLAGTYFQKYGIKNNPKDLNYNCSLEKFWNQLYEIRKKYDSSNTKLVERLDKEIEKYKSYIGYEELKSVIVEIKQKTISAIGNDANKDYVHNCIKNMHTIIKQNFIDYFKRLLSKEVEKYKDYAGYNEYVKIRIPGKIDMYTDFALERSFDNLRKDEFISKFNDEIENIFARNNIIIERINKIKKIFKDNPKYLEDEELMGIYEELSSYEKEFNRGTDISNYLDNIEKELENVLVFKENEDVIKKVYDALLTKYHNKLTSLKLPADHKKAIELSKLFASLMGIFAKMENKEIDIDSALDILSKIKFENIDEDMALIESPNIINIKSGVYIKKPEYMGNNYYDESFFYLKEESGEYFMYHIDGSATSKTKISVEEIKTKFITLEEFLQKSEYIGKEFERIITDYLLLYKFGQISILLSSNGYFKINQNVSEHLSTPTSYLKYGGDYKDVNKLISAIKEQVEKNIIFYERTHIRFKIH